MKQTKACGIIIFKGFPREYLLIQKINSGNWGFPKGHVEGEESEHETALREVFEETGLRVKIIDRFRESVAYDESKKAHKTLVLFLGEPLGTNVAIQKDEILDFAWLKYEDALERLRYNNSKEMLRRAEKFISN